MAELVSSPVSEEPILEILIFTNNIMTQMSIYSSIAMVLAAVSLLLKGAPIFSGILFLEDV